MAFFHSPRNNSFGPLEVNILYWEFNHPQGGTNFSMHCHPFWQIEIIKSGQPRLNTVQAPVQLKEKDIIVIPPFLQHGFSYPRSGIEYYSFKLEVKGLKPPETQVRLRKSQETVLLEQVLDTLLAENMDIRHSKAILVKNLLTALLEIQRVSADPEESKSPLVDTVEKLIRQHSTTRISVNALARELGYSRNHLSILFRQEVGLPLKSFIDHFICSTAESLLLYSEMNVSEIAYSLSFCNVHTFSRFFKRISGRSPTAFKKHMLRLDTPQNQEDMLTKEIN
jgi:AraC-like DNA-binding protein